MNTYTDAQGKVYDAVLCKDGRYNCKGCAFEDDAALDDCTKANDIADCFEFIWVERVQPVRPCPEPDKYSFADSTQCWEPCGDLGKSHEHAKVSEQEVVIQAPDRKTFEQWYSDNAFDYVANPVGSRDCGLQWAAYKAGFEAGWKHVYKYSAWASTATRFCPSCGERTSAGSVHICSPLVIE